MIGVPAPSPEPDSVAETDTLQNQLTTVTITASFRIMDAQHIWSHRRCHPVLHTPELLLTIFDAVREPPLTPEEKTTGVSLWKYMLVCKYWYFTIRKTIWSHLTRPNEAFDAVLRQSDGDFGHFSHKVRT